MLFGSRRFVRALPYLSFSPCVCFCVSVSVCVRRRDSCYRRYIISIVSFNLHFGSKDRHLRTLSRSILRLPRRDLSTVMEPRTGEVVAL